MRGPHPAEREPLVISKKIRRMQLDEEISANPVPISSHARPESRKTITGHFAEASISLSSARATVSVGVAGLSEVARLGVSAMGRRWEEARIEDLGVRI